MKACFNYAVRYRVEVHCLTPIRTGAAENNMEIVLRDWNGTPFMQGTSLTGALRAWKDNVALFGRQKGDFSSRKGNTSDREGSLIVSDLRFDEQSKQTIRPRLAMDGATGTGANKFDVASLNADTRGEFTLLWQGEKAQKKQCMAQIEEYLSALHAGEILLGSQKTNGFGRVRLTVHCQEYDMTQADDLTAWLEDETPNEVDITSQIQSSTFDKSYVTFGICADLHHILIQSPFFDGKGGENVKAYPMTENGKFLIPASSVKGAVKAHMAKIAPHCINGEEETTKELAQQLMTQLFGRGAEKGGKREDNGASGKIRFEDITFDKAVLGTSTDLSQTPKKSRIRINRLTGGVINQALFTEKPIDVQNATWSITVPLAEKAGCGLLLFALRDFGLGLFNLGSGDSIGHGRASKVTVTVSVPNQKELTLTATSNNVTITDPDHLCERWLQALKEGK